MKYYFVAGEASGDMHASHLMKALKKWDAEASFRCLGGDKMQQQGAILAKHYKSTAYMGIGDVVRHLPQILRNIRYIKKDLLAYKPDVLILVDYPGFNLRIAEFAHKAGLKVYYYISPKIWAWKQSRVKKIKRYIDKLFVIFPFEKDFYNTHNYPVEYVGNPVLDALDLSPDNRAEFLVKYHLPDKKIIALLPGSRIKEVKRNLPLMLRTSRHFTDYQFIIAVAPSLDQSLFAPYIAEYDTQLIFDDTYRLLKNSEAALVTSGTATLETAILNIPELVCYKLDSFSYKIGKLLVKIPFISLVNLIMGKEIIKEFIQEEMSEENLKKELDNLLHNKTYRSEMTDNFEQMRKVLGGGGASEATAQIIVKSLR